MILFTRIHSPYVRAKPANLRARRPGGVVADQGLRDGSQDQDRNQRHIRAPAACDAHRGRPTANTPLRFAWVEPKGRSGWEAEAEVLAFA